MSQAATSQVYPSRSARPPPLAHSKATALGPHCSRGRLRRPNRIFEKLPLGKLHIWQDVP